jgi:hypothetical protein
MRIGLVVCGDDGDLQAPAIDTDASVRIDLVRGERGAIQHVLSERSELAGQGLADADLQRTRHALTGCESSHEQHDGNGPQQADWSRHTGVHGDGFGC